MDNKQIARVLRETAQLLEIDGAIIGRYRSYERAAGDRRPHGRASAGNCEDRRLRAAQEAAEEISGDDSGFAATAVIGTEESGFPVGEFQDGHRGGRGKAGER